MLPFSIMSNTNILSERIRIKKMESGEEHVALLYDNGELYTRGIGTDGRLGTGNTNANYISWNLVLQDVKDVWCGSYFTLALKNDNTFWYVGKKSMMGSTETTLSWIDITSFFSSTSITGDDIKKIELGTNSMLLLSTTNSLYVSGRNLGGELGTGSTAAVTQLTLKDTNVSDISFCSSFSTYTKNGELYRSGVGNWGQMGNGSTTGLTTFTSFSAPANSTLERVCSNTRDIYYLYRDNTSGVSSFYVNGYNVNGELGTGRTGQVNTRTKVPSLDNRVISISTRWGLLHKTILLDDGVYASGTNSGGQCGVGNNTLISTFTKCVGLPPGIPQYMIPFNNYGTFIVINDIIYWCGIAQYFTGSSGNQTSFIQLSTPYNY